ncbi:hypothetical protein NE237_003562 [Protea cynaroides]|uniref:Uncharacterized protein n=1 Tax=Protea cynaroides TaxID=273540 RepID=A0A9Q0KH29_9MAGN|nr:hypothetical protein NE237_003562 [Protea cynaroides]
MLLLPPAVPTPNGFGNEDQTAMRKKILVQLIQLNAQQNAPIEQFQLIPISNVALLDFFEIIKMRFYDLTPYVYKSPGWKAKPLNSLKTVETRQSSFLFFFLSESHRLTNQSM